MAPVALSFSEAGAGTPLVVIHGLFGNKRNWGMISRALADRYRILTVDLRNHGESPWDPEMTYPAMAEDIAAFIEKEVGGPAHVLGHSMGGKAAMVLALTQPDLIDKLIVADIPPAPRNSGLRAYIKAMRALDVGSMKRRSEAEDALEPAIPERSIRTFLAQNLTPADGGGLTWRLNLPVIDASMDAIEGFPEFDTDDAFPRPVLHLIGADSDHVLPHHHAEIDRLFPHSEVVEIPEAGHWLHAEQPKAFVAAVESFLGR